MWRCSDGSEALNCGYFHSPAPSACCLTHLLCFLCSWWAPWRRAKCPTAVSPSWWSRRRKLWMREARWRWTGAEAASEHEGSFRDAEKNLLVVFFLWVVMTEKRGLKCKWRYLNDNNAIKDAAGWIWPNQVQTSVTPECFLGWNGIWWRRLRFVFPWSVFLSVFVSVEWLLLNIRCLWHYSTQCICFIYCLLTNRLIF